MYLAQQRVLQPTQTAIFSTILDHELDSLQQSAHESLSISILVMLERYKKSQDLKAQLITLCSDAGILISTGSPFFDSVLNPSILQWSTSCYEVISS